MAEPHRLAKPLIFALLAVPLLLMADDAFLTPLSANPYPTAIRDSGLWSMRLLVLGLALSPWQAAGGTAGVIKLRRMVGLYAAFYAALHLAIWCKKYGFDWSFLASEIAARLYLLVGLVALLLLVPLGATSNRAALRRLGGRAWRRLHWLVYPAALLALWHYLLAGRLYDRELVFDIVILALLLLWRVHRALRPAGARRRALPQG
jgi:sulfoxide reductase heme-binding subunit YedZ